MTKTTKIFLVIDAIVNLFLGILLLLFPFGVAQILGAPVPYMHFYPTILGAVLVGIGISLLIDVLGQPHALRGLGIAGTIAIYFCAGGVLT